MLRSGPYAIRFVERGSDLVLQNEWFEIDRTIHMDGKEPPPTSRSRRSATRRDAGTATRS